MTNDTLKRKTSYGISNLKKHIFLCCDQTKPNCCSKEMGLQSWEYLKKRLDELGLTQKGIFRTKANCLRICNNGPIMVIHPENIWYYNCTPATIEKIINEHLLQNIIVEEYLLEPKC